MNAEESAVSENVPKGGEDKTSSRFQGHVVMNAPQLSKQMFKQYYEKFLLVNLEFRYLSQIS